MSCGRDILNAMEKCNRGGSASDQESRGKGRQLATSNSNKLQSLLTALWSVQEIGKILLLVKNFVVKNWVPFVYF